MSRRKAHANANSGSDFSPEADAYEDDGTMIPSPPAALSQEENVREPPRPYVPINFDLREDIIESMKREKQVKENIRLVDREYRNKKIDPLRSELYKDLLRYFRSTPIEKMRVLVHDVSDKSFKRFIKPDPELLKSRSLDKKKKIQKLVNYLCTNEKRSREVLYSTACRMSLLWIGKANQKEHWTAFRLKRPRTEQYPEDITVLDFLSFVAREFEKKLNEIEARNYREGQTNICYYIHSRLTTGIGYVGLRIQTIPGERRRRRKRVDHETSETVIFAVKPHFPHFFVHGKEQNPDPDIMKLFTSCLRYKHYEAQNLSARDLTLMIESCARKLVVPKIEEFTKKFDEEEKAMSARGVYYADRAGALRTHYQCAMLQDGQQLAGVNTYTIRNKLEVPRSTGDEPGAKRKYSEMETMIKVGKGVCLDDYVVDLYKRGIITDLKAFMKMKATGSNIYVESDEEAEVED